MDWVEVLKVVGGFLGAIVSLLGALFGVRMAEPALRPRSKLKADLEILNILEPGDPNYDVVRGHINAMITKLYGLPGQQVGPKRPKVHNWSALILGIICFPGFSFWTWYMVRDGFSWWAIVTGFLHLLPLAGLLWLLRRFLKIRNKHPEGIPHLQQLSSQFQLYNCIPHAQGFVSALVY